jgi:4-deoxy-L-threo-5-hexosulose-uronate ketol-isomerase
MKTIYSADPVRYRSLSTAELRENFLLQLFVPGELQCVYSDADRAVIGSAVPTGQPLVLGSADELRSAYFCERREVGILNVGQPGRVTVDGKVFEMETLDALYVGRGSKTLVFESLDNAAPAAFYLLSYPAHTEYPTQHAKKADAEAAHLGTVADANRRTIYKYIHPQGIKSCQLVLGFTQLEEGSIWNTMPSHTHARRSEIYLYFNLTAQSRVVHLMGEPNETRHLMVANREVVISPSWSIHSGAGTSAYTFCWGMGGENQAFGDMDAVATQDLR